MPTDLAPLRTLLGDRLLEDATTLKEFASDFGRLIQRPPLAVARPASAEDVVAIVRWARGAGAKLVNRGQAHSQSGLSTGKDAVLLDLSLLAEVGTPDVAARTVSVGGGAVWRDIVAKCLGSGLIPPVLTNNLGVSVGGTLSVAGLGIASFREGCQGDQVLELEVVTGAGDRVICGPDREKELFDAVRSGLGLSGVIVRAVLRLVPAKPMVRTHYLLYDDLASLMKDGQELMTHHRFGYLESWCVPCPQGFRKVGGAPTPFAQWFFPLHASVEFDPASPPDDEALLAGLHHYRAVHVEDRSMAEFANRLEPLFELWKRGGYWANAHPWMEVVLPWGAAAAYITGVLANFPPHALGGGHILLWPSRGSVSKVPNFQTPPGEFVMGFGILPGLPAPAMAMAGPLLDRASAMALKMGAKRYPSGYHTFGREEWKAHFGARWDGLVASKAKYDPDGILNPDLLG